MKTILILTVGGSHQPILRSIERNLPDFVHFLCSSDSGRAKGSYTQVIGEGKVLKSSPELAHPDLLNIVTLASLKADQYQVHRIDKFDNLNDCYLTALKVIEDSHADADTRLIADYTGGTKSMTAGLAAAALDDGRCEIQMVSGVRQDLKQVVDQTEFVRPVMVWDAQVRRQMLLVQSLVARFDYAGAARMLEETAARYASDATIVTLQRWLGVCRVFDAWDKFDHKRACQLLQPYRGKLVQYALILDAIVKGNGHGFELVEDLLLNAQRRAAQGRYDDATGRLYRALELTAQVWLQQQHNIDTGNVSITLMPAELRTSIERQADEKGVIKLGLIHAWDVIGAFPSDPLGELFKQERRKLMNFLSLRNQSLFAHGLSAISEENYNKSALIISQFVQKAIEVALADLKKKQTHKPQQFPARLEYDS